MLASRRRTRSAALTAAATVATASIFTLASCGEESHQAQDTTSASSIPSADQAGGSESGTSSDSERTGQESEAGGNSDKRGRTDKNKGAGSDTVSGEGEHTSTIPNSPAQPLGHPSLDKHHQHLSTGTDHSVELTVTGIRIAEHRGFDRIVFDLQGPGRPGWFTDYVYEPRQQASGHTINIPGQAFLDVGIEGITYNLNGTGPKGLSPGAQPQTKHRSKNVSVVHYGGTFEARDQYIIGLNHQATPYSVTFLDNPKRLVVDVTGK